MPWRILCGLVQSRPRDDFFAPMRTHGLLAGPEAARDYVRLANPYVSLRTGKPNPHKSYGYLVQPKLAKWLARFLEE